MVGVIKVGHRAAATPAQKVRMYLLLRTCDTGIWRVRNWFIIIIIIISNSERTPCCQLAAAPVQRVGLGFSILLRFQSAKDSLRYVQIQCHTSIYSQTLYSATCL